MSVKDYTGFNRAPTQSVTSMVAACEPKADNISSLLAEFDKLNLRLDCISSIIRCLANDVGGELPGEFVELTKSEPPVFSLISRLASSLLYGNKVATMIEVDMQRLAKALGSSSES